MDGQDCPESWLYKVLWMSNRHRCPQRDTGHPHSVNRSGNSLRCLAVTRQHRQTIIICCLIHHPSCIIHAVTSNVPRSPLCAARIGHPPIVGHLWISTRSRSHRPSQCTPIIATETFQPSHSWWASPVSSCTTKQSTAGGTAQVECRNRSCQNTKFFNLFKIVKIVKNWPVATRLCATALGGSSEYSKGKTSSC